jgi:hypothetical protein
MPEWNRDRHLGDQIARRVFPAQHEHHDDPVAWIHERLRAETWSGQDAIARAVAKHRRTACASAHGVGKDWTAAALIAWWLSTRSDAFVVTSAPTGPQLSGILWREIARLHRRGELAGTVTATGTIPTWRIGSELIGWGRKPADLSDPDEAASAFTGIHAKSVLVVLDEASGLDDWLVDAALTLLTSEDSRLLAIGNPLDPASRFARLCAPGSGFETLSFSVFDTPAFTGEKVSADLLAVLPSQEWVSEREADWGRGSPAWIARVEGKFPPSSPDTLIAPHLILAAQAKDLPAEGDPRLAVDVARSGSDRTIVAARWQSGRVRIVHEAHGDDTMKTAAQVKRLLDVDFGPPELHEVTAAVDVVGLGAGTFDRLRQLGARAVEFSSAARAYNPERFANRRAEVYWQLRTDLEAGAIDLDPHDAALAAQLGALKWKPDGKGRILIESKDEIRARGLPSPDRADAVSMTAQRRPASAVLNKPLRGSRPPSIEAEWGNQQTTEEAWGEPRRGWQERLDEASGSGKGELDDWGRM